MTCHDKKEGSIVAYDRQAWKIAYVAHHFTEKECVLMLVIMGLS
jgi:hypothetical protein